jgi:hypothetical protein
MKHRVIKPMPVSAALDPIALAELWPHGRYIDPRHSGGISGASTDEERPAGGLSGTVKRFKKEQSASGQAAAYGWIKATYRDAIEYSGMKGPLEGGIMMGAFMGLMIGMITVGGGIWMAMMPFFAGSKIPPLWVLLISFVLGAATALGCGAASAWMILTPIRHTYRAPCDLPIIFDRATRRVYRMVRAVQSGLIGLFQPWPLLAVAYDWELLDAEHDVEVVGSAATVSRLPRLSFVVRKSAQDRTIIDHFEVGNAMAQGETMVAPMWEHIRRFMGGKGPHLPDPREVLDSRDDAKPTWWQACGEVGPFGSRYLWWWRHQIFISVLYHVIAGFTLYSAVWSFLLHGSWASAVLLMGPWVALSINWGHGTGKWLVAHTSRTYDWPQAVKDAIGPATARGKGW